MADPEMMHVLLPVGDQDAAVPALSVLTPRVSLLCNVVVLKLQSTITFKIYRTNFFLFIRCITCSGLWSSVIGELSVLQ